jgi:polysaccharide chain length determinant protein (PEP-CTERM system associated)
MLDELQEPLSKNHIDYWGMLRRRGWWFFVPCFLAWGVFVASLYTVVPAKYRSQATILASGQLISDKYVPSNIQSPLPQRLQSMTQQILSRTKLEKVIDDFHLYPKERAKLSPDQLVEKLRKDVEIHPVPIDDLAEEEDPAQAAKRALTLAPGTGKPPDNLVFRLSYAAPKPYVAQQVTNELVSLFIEENLAQRQRQSESTTNFLQSQVEDSQKQLEGQEARIQQYKSRYVGQLPEQKESNLQILASLQTRLQSVSDGLNRAEQQKLYLESLSQQYNSLQAALSQGDAASVQSPAALDKQLEKLRGQLTNLKGQYTERHPDVRALEEQIAEAEKLKKETTEQIQKAKTLSSEAKDSGPAKDNTMHATSLAELQQLSPMLQVESQLKANAGEIDNDRTAMAELQKQIADYQGRLNLTPIREAELENITRDYNQLKANYESLVGKQRDSQVSTNLERRQQGQQFVMLNPPSLPAKPNAPNRFTLSLMGLGVGAGIGLFVAVSSELGDNRIHGDNDLKGLVTAPILGSISKLLTRGERQSLNRRSRLESLTATFMVAVMAIGTAFTFFHG